MSSLGSTQGSAASPAQVLVGGQDSPKSHAIRNSIHKTSVGRSRRLQHGFRQVFAAVFFSIIKIPFLDKNKTKQTSNYIGFAWVRNTSNSRKTMTLNLRKKSLSQGQSWLLVKYSQQWRKIFIFHCHGTLPLLLILFILCCFNI